MGRVLEFRPPSDPDPEAQVREWAESLSKGRAAAQRRQAAASARWQREADKRLADFQAYMRRYKRDRR